MRTARVPQHSSGEQREARLPPELAGLLDPRAYPHPAGTVSLIETPISWVLLAGAFAYKIKRPVRYPFVDQRGLEHRRWLCGEELRLNRRFAPELYLAVCPIVVSGSRTRVNLGPAGTETVVEYAVRMQRFDAADVLDRQLAEAGLAPEALGRFGCSLAEFHVTLPSVTEDMPWGQPQSVHALLVENLLECAAAAEEFGAREAVAALRGPLEERLLELAPAMTLRRASGQVRECHGDLHSRNIVVRGERLVPFDCLEYEPAFRWIDVADEIAFLCSDLAAHGYPAHAHAFLAGYLERSGDYHACRLIRLYEAHRALVRAKVAALAAAQRRGAAQRSPLREEHEQLVAHATAALTIRAPRLVLVSGLSGSGKTWLARQLAARLLAVHLRSDVERKRLAGLMALDRSGSGLAEGLYSPQVSERVYDELARDAYDALIGGYTVIVDATLLRHGQRQRFTDLGERAGAETHLLRCTAPLEVLRDRLRARAAVGGDPSEADESVLEWQRKQLETDSDGPLEAIEVDSTDPGALQKVIGRLGATAPG